MITPPGSLPGLMSFASAPTMRPMIRTQMMCMTRRPFVDRGCCAGHANRLSLTNATPCGDDTVSCARERVLGASGLHEGCVTFRASNTMIAKTGIDGLDNVLCSGFPRNRLYLVQGDPGVGKTTLALQYLIEGARTGERCLYVTLSESETELRAVARSHGWALDGIVIYEMSVGAGESVQDDENTLYVPAEVELGERMQTLLAEVDRVKPARIVVDSCSELRLLAQTPLRFRRQVLALKHDLVRRDCTILLLDNPVSAG